MQAKPLNSDRYIVNIHKNCNYHYNCYYFIHSREILQKPGLIDLQMLNFVDKEKTFFGIPKATISISKMKSEDWA